MEKLRFSFPCAIVLIFLLSNGLITISATPNSTAGLSLDLIHIDSVRSPFHRPNMTDEQRIQRLVDISYNQMRSIEHSLSAPAVSPLRMTMTTRTDPLSHLHLVFVNFGTPPTGHLLFLDTASSLIWVRCVPPRASSSTSPPGQVFEPRRSSTYRRASPTDPLCHGPPFSEVRNECRFDITYQDGRSTRGVLSRDVLTGRSVDGDPVPFPNLAFGCAEATSGNAFSTDGVLGMAAGPLSLPRQLGEGFSYCLSGNPEVFTRLRMGSDMLRVRGRHRMASTRMIEDAGHYSVNLVDISIGGRRLRLPEESLRRRNGGGGNCVVQTGSSYTFLKKGAFEKVASFMNAHFHQHHNLRPVDSPPMTLGVNLMICYPARMSADELPDMVFHLEGGVDLTIRGNHVFTITRATHMHRYGATCLAMMPTDAVTLLGSYQQRDIRFVYNVESSRLEFSPEDCSQDRNL